MLIGLMGDAWTMVYRIMLVKVISLSNVAYLAAIANSPALKARHSQSALGLAVFFCSNLFVKYATFSGYATNPNQKKHPCNLAGLPSSSKPTVQIAQSWLAAGEADPKFVRVMLQMLDRLPMGVKALQDSGIGKTMAKLKKQVGRRPCIYLSFLLLSARSWPICSSSAQECSEY